MMESILLSIKKMLGPSADNNEFDADIIMHINTALMALTQIGVGPENGFYIEDDTSTWHDFIGNENIEAIKTYIYIKVKLVFDPPVSSTVIKSLESQATELEWRINHQVDKPSDIPEVIG